MGLTSSYIGCYILHLSRETEEVQTVTATQGIVGGVGGDIVRNGPSDGSGDPKNKAHILPR